MVTVMDLDFPGIWSIDKLWNVNNFMMWSEGSLAYILPYGDNLKI